LPSGERSRRDGENERDMLINALYNVVATVKDQDFLRQQKVESDSFLPCVFFFFRSSNAGIPRNRCPGSVGRGPWPPRCAPNTQPHPAPCPQRGPRHLLPSNATANAARERPESPSQPSSFIPDPTPTSSDVGCGTILHPPASQPPPSNPTPALHRAILSPGRR